MNTNKSIVHDLQEKQIINCFILLWTLFLPRKETVVYLVTQSVEKYTFFTGEFCLSTLL